MNDDELNALTEKIIGCAFKVSNTLGSGFLEKVYENALAIELRKIELETKQQAPIKVLYERSVVGEYYADLLVANVVIVELKAVNEFSDLFTAQCLNYLKATGLPICLLLNFGKPRVEVKRFRF
ncbi:MAG: GxxExxY protein [Planctomycetota bacterium]